MMITANRIATPWRTPEECSFVSNGSPWAMSTTCGGKVGACLGSTNDGDLLGPGSVSSGGGGSNISSGDNVGGMPRISGSNLNFGSGGFPLDSGGGGGGGFKKALWRPPSWATTCASFLLSDFLSACCRSLSRASKVWSSSRTLERPTYVLTMCQKTRSV
eukprot:CAMPEP_0206437434 /NCGR_PEP_ID=MMETSP0324_2-20121206/11038_1 /ASSEMBLY_ACC=CAM_ASM_000836 /TAXON_ID=2866 /ORGANISM="Crypthecodinium cohnii, Strain Seligo" /LENGTH=159 /DNA_ID=CAMNT_0053904713 /DNA_START=190 /DNA_END=669 /DNA_ORIENTATION=-